MGFRTVILGAAGNFGARIVRALQQDSGIEVIRASRGAGGDPSGGQARLDIDEPGFKAALGALRPDLVIHCVGPFQGQDYHVARAALAAGAHYLDLADGRAFVAGFAAQNDGTARAAGRLAISGASTLPALSSAVVDSLLRHFRTPESIEIAIAPGQRAPRGTATLKGVFSYLGRPLRWRRGGRWVRVHGWQELKRLKFAFGMRWAAACDVPDLELLPQRYPAVRTVEFRAALEFGVEHFGLWLAAGLRRARVPVPMEHWAPGLNFLASALDRFGGPWGGMLVSLAGVGPQGKRRRLTWQIVAPVMDGPEIPCMAAVLLARRLAAGPPAATGAYPCMGFLELQDFEPEFARWGMRTQVTESMP